jgi:RNA polymerase sigma factor (sigma-70 family)
VRRKVAISDVVQEARIEALGLAPQFQERHGGAARAWLLKIVELKAREAVRRYATTAKRAVAREITHEGRPDTRDWVARGPSPSDAAIGLEAAQAVAKAMSVLPPPYRDVLRLTRVEGMSIGDAARRMGRSRDAAKKLYGRALSRFTEIFGALTRAADE